MTRSTNILLILALVVAGCSGGSDNSDGTGTTITTKVGAATVTKFLKPGVVILSGDAPVTQVDSQTLVMSPARPDIKANMVFVWQDRPYFVISQQADGAGSRLTVRPATFDETLLDLTVVGDLTLSDFDQSQMIVDQPLQDDTSQAAANSSVSARAATTPAKKFDISCKTQTDRNDQPNPSSFVCTLTTTLSDGLLLTGKIGIEHADFSGIKIGFKNRIAHVSQFSADPFFFGGVTTTNAEDKEQKLDFEVPLLRAKYPLPQTFNFLHLEVPVVLTASLPLFRFQAGFKLAAPIRDTSLTVTGSFDTPVATVSTNGDFRYELDDSFGGLKLGVELVAGRLPLGKVRLDLLSLAKPDPDRLAAAGLYGRFGMGGKLSFEASATKKTSCFKYAVNGQAGVSVEADYKLGSFSGKFEDITLTNFSPPNKAGASGDGCEDVPISNAQVKVKSFTCSTLSSGPYSGATQMDMLLSARSSYDYTVVLLNGQHPYSATAQCGAWEQLIRDPGCADLRNIALVDSTVCSACLRRPGAPTQTDVHLTVVNSRASNVSPLGAYLDFYDQQGMMTDSERLVDDAANTFLCPN